MLTKKPNLGGLLLGFFYVWCLRDLSRCHHVSWQPCKTWLELRNTRDVQTAQEKRELFMRLPIKLHLHVRS